MKVTVNTDDWSATIFETGENIDLDELLERYASFREKKSGLPESSIFIQYNWASDNIIYLYNAHVYRNTEQLDLDYYQDLISETIMQFHEGIITETEMREWVNSYKECQARLTEGLIELAIMAKIEKRRKKYSGE